MGDSSSNNAHSITGEMVGVVNKNGRGFQIFARRSGGATFRTGPSFARVLRFLFLLQDVKRIDPECMDQVTVYIYRY